MAKLEMYGTKELMKTLREKGRMELAKEIVKTNGEEMQEKMTINANLQPKGVFTGYTDSSGNFIKPTGATKRSITGSLSAGGMTYTASPGTFYSPYVNYGTRYMAPRPFVTNAFNDQKEQFKRDMERATK